jgi:hypothetical protein
VCGAGFAGASSGLPSTNNNQANPRAMMCTVLVLPVLVLVDLIPTTTKQHTERCSVVLVELIPTTTKQLTKTTIKQLPETATKQLAGQWWVVLVDLIPTTTKQLTEQ